jgi:hypothetical protein
VRIWPPRRIIDEAYEAGRFAVESALSGETGKMAAFERFIDNGRYACRMLLQPLEKVANVEKKVPREWINEEATTSCRSSSIMPCRSSRARTSAFLSMACRASHILKRFW